MRLTPAMRGFRFTAAGLLGLDLLRTASSTYPGCRHFSVGGVWVGGNSYIAKLPTGSVRHEQLRPRQRQQAKAVSRGARAVTKQTRSEVKLPACARMELACSRPSIGQLSIRHCNKKCEWSQVSFWEIENEGVQ